MKTAPFQQDFIPRHFKARHTALFAATGPQAQVVLQGAAHPRGYELFRQTNEFYYCCGVVAPGAYLRLSDRGQRASLYLPARGRARSTSEQPLTAEDADAIVANTCIDAVHGIECLAEHLAAATVIYTPHAPAEHGQQARDVLTRANRAALDDPWDGQSSRETRFVERLRERFPRATIRDLSPILDGLRGVKDPQEIALMRKAGALSAAAVTEAMRAARPGMLEGELDGIAQRLYLANGARGPSYRAIIPGGVNAWDSHYVRNNEPLRDGDLVLMDTAPDVGHYTSDIGRMWPVNGAYQPWQRELYGYIVEYHKLLLSLIRPGITAQAILGAAADRMREIVGRTSFSKPAYRAAAERTLAFAGHLSHPVGMAVHDVGAYGEKPLWPGLVFAVDPQMWVPEECLYIRVEDTVLVTDQGIEILTRDATLELDDVEALVRGAVTPVP